MRFENVTVFMENVNILNHFSGTDNVPSEPHSVKRFGFGCDYTMIFLRNTTLFLDHCLFDGEISLGADSNESSSSNDTDDDDDNNGSDHHNNEGRFLLQAGLIDRPSVRAIPSSPSSLIILLCGSIFSAAHSIFHHSSVGLFYIDNSVLNLTKGNVMSSHSYFPYAHDYNSISRSITNVFDDDSITSDDIKYSPSYIPLFPHMRMNVNCSKSGVVSLNDTIIDNSILYSHPMEGKQHSATRESNSIDPSGFSWILNVDCVVTGDVINGQSTSDVRPKIPSPVLTSADLTLFEWDDLKEHCIFGNQLPDPVISFGGDNFFPFRFIIKFCIKNINSEFSFSVFPDNETTYGPHPIYHTSFYSSNVTIDPSFESEDTLYVPSTPSTASTCPSFPASPSSYYYFRMFRKAVGESVRLNSAAPVSVSVSNDGGLVFSNEIRLNVNSKIHSPSSSFSKGYEDLYSLGSAGYGMCVEREGLCGDAYWSATTWPVGQSAPGVCLEVVKCNQLNKYDCMRNVFNCEWDEKLSGGLNNQVFMFYYVFCC
jgi:hypothetical protein